MNETPVESEKPDSKNPVIAAVIAASLTVLLPHFGYLGLHPRSSTNDLFWMWTIISDPPSISFVSISIPGSFRFLFVYRYYYYFRGSYTFKKLVCTGIIVQVPILIVSLLSSRFPFWFAYPIPFMVILCLLLAKAVGAPHGAIPDTELTGGVN